MIRLLKAWYKNHREAIWGLGIAYVGCAFFKWAMIWTISNPDKAHSFPMDIWSFIINLGGILG